MQTRLRVLAIGIITVLMIIQGCGGGAMSIDIPKEHRCDPYEISPSGDIFWADKRNVEIVKKAIENKDQVADKLNSADDIKNFLNNL